MRAGRARRVKARLAVVELRSLLFADAYMGLRRRRRLIELAATLIEDSEAADKFQRQMISLVRSRFGRNPDTFELSVPTVEALRLLDVVQRGSFQPTSASE